MVVDALLAGPRRFNDLLVDVPGIAANILSGRLRALEAAALVVASPYSTRPPRFVYELTATGLELAGALRLLADWGARQSERTDPLRHSLCGTPLEARWYCPSCEETVADPEAEEGQIV